MDFHNVLNLNEDGKSPQEMLSGFNGDIDVKHFHTWGCPVFVLDHQNQSGLGGTSKWNPKAKIGMYLGRSPVHASSVALVLNLVTGHVSP